MRDLRVDLILRIEDEHRPSHMATKEASGGEAHRCRCGVAFKGDGALKNGRRHRAEALLAALDEAGVTA